MVVKSKWMVKACVTVGTKIILQFHSKILRYETTRYRVVTVMQTKVLLLP